VILAGTHCGLMFAAANRDPRKWTDPDRFDFKRDLRSQLGWGYGIRSCVGRTLAQLEADALLGALIERIDRFEAAGDPQWRITTFSPWRMANPKICLTRSRTWMAVAGAPRSTIALQSPRRSSGVISVSSRLRHLGSNSRFQIDRRIARVLSAIGAFWNPVSPNSPKLLASLMRRF
jgi:hypothetical protein